MKCINQVIMILFGKRLIYTLYHQIFLQYKKSNDAGINVFIYSQFHFALFKIISLCSMRTKHTVKIEEEELFYHPGSLSKQNHSAETPLRIKWSVEESYIYMTYLRLFADNFRRPKFFKPFVRMSKLITTRSSRQIKSHHQKMLLKYQSISQIVREVELFLDYQEERLKLSLVEQLAQRFEPLFHAEQQCLSYGIHNKPRKVKNKKEVNKEQSIGQSQGMKVKCEEKQAQIYHFEQSKSEEEPVQQ